MQETIVAFTIVDVNCYTYVKTKVLLVERTKSFLWKIFYGSFQNDTKEDWDLKSDVAYSLRLKVFTQAFCRHTQPHV